MWEINFVNSSELYPISKPQTFLYLFSKRKKPLNVYKDDLTEYWAVLV